MLGRIPTFLLTTFLLMVVIFIVLVPWSDLPRLLLRTRFSLGKLLGGMALLGVTLGIARHSLAHENPAFAMLTAVMLVSIVFIMLSLTWYFLRNVFQPSASGLRDRWRDPTWSRAKLPQRTTYSSNHLPHDSPPNDQGPQQVAGQATSPGRKSGKPGD